MTNQSRELWIDAVKGLTIILVVFHHVFQGVQTSIGFSDLTLEIYRLTSPIRMPLFFLVAGFFAKKAIEGDLKNFVHGKLLHFAYFYILWSIVSIGVRYLLSSFTNNEVKMTDILHIFWEPTFSLWFLYALFLAFATARLTRNISFLTQISIFTLIAVTLNTVPNNDFILIKTFKLYPFFLIGVYGSSQIRSWVSKATVTRVGWLIVTYILIAASISLLSWKVNSVHYYVMALLGCAAVMSLIYVTKNTFLVSRVLTYVGERSLYIYLMHFVPAAAVRVIGVKLGFESYPLLMSLIGTLISVGLCLIVFKVLQSISILKFLLEKPSFRAKLRSAY
ncbi:acyltransferase family protein [Rheinheimera sp. NSM]|uniref:acyltransferase family protein n=1 Tax=Rheinheimera sp. NSM TaxID=3457884 RepID=UPI004035A294